MSCELPQFDEWKSKKKGKLKTYTGDHLIRANQAPINADQEFSLSLKMVEDYNQYCDTIGDEKPGMYLGKINGSEFGDKIKFSATKNAAAPWKVDFRDTRVIRSAPVILNSDIDLGSGSDKFLINAKHFESGLRLDGKWDYSSGVGVQKPVTLSFAEGDDILKIKSGYSSGYIGYNCAIEMGGGNDIFRFGSINKNGRTYSDLTIVGDAYNPSAPKGLLLMGDGDDIIKGTSMYQQGMIDMGRGDDIINSQMNGFGVTDFGEGIDRYFVDPGTYEIQGIGQNKFLMPAGGGGHQLTVVGLEYLVSRKTGNEYELTEGVIDVA